MSPLPWPEATLAGRDWRGVSALLDRLVERERAGAMPGTLLLVGAPGLGREALAVELAALVTCRAGGQRGCPCSSCDRARRGVHPDVEVVDVLPDKKEISRDQAHAVIDRILQRPYEGRRRVFVLSSCHNPPLNEVAGSALLKTLEEPPGHVLFLLLAANPARVLPTIVSRSVQVRVPPPTVDELARLLAALHGMDEAAARELATAGDAALALGGPGLAGRAPELGRLALAALAGDALALLRLASECAAPPASPSLAAGALLARLADAEVEQAEGIAVAAAALVQAERRATALRTDVESEVVGLLAPLVARS